VRQLARLGRSRETRDLQDWLRRAGAPSSLQKNLAREVSRSLERAKKKKRGKPGKTDGIARQLRKVATALAASLADVGEGKRRQVAALALELDADQPAAHKALGRVEWEGTWVRSGVVAMRKRRAEIAAVVRRARRMKVELTVGESAFKELFGKVGFPGALQVAYKDRLRLHAHDVPEDKLRRVATNILRASVVSNWLWTGKEEIPHTRRATNIVFCGKTPAYFRWVDYVSSTPKSRIGKQSRDWGSFEWGGLVVNRPKVESAWSASGLDDVVYALMRDVFGGVLQPTLRAGHLHWLCLTYLGTPSPTYVIYEDKTKRHEETRTGAKNRVTIERERMFRLKDAGLTGLHSWMVYLAARREDPPWRKSFQEQMGKIDGNSLLKTTTVVQMLQESGEFNALAKATRTARGDVSARAEVFKKTLGRPLPEFEKSWREWILPTGGTGLAQRLGGASKTEPGAARFLNYLDGKRRSSFWFQSHLDECPPLELDASLSKGCLAHARYLAKNADQQQIWPDVHDERSDRPGFTPAGAWAAQNSVIAYDETRPEDAVDGWMATFYHRLPLLDPGLLRIGWGLHEGIAVLDCGSLAGPYPVQTIAVWPAHRSRGVPRRFAPEIPNPVPGADQSQWGYPITLQIFGPEHDPDIPMRLFVGSEKVDCYYSSPFSPTNIEIVPKGAYCLIPKRPLLPNTRYEVRATDPIYDNKPFRWYFTTGAK
jgi:hypothetical protein